MLGIFYQDVLPGEIYPYVRGIKADNEWLVKAGSRCAR